MINTLDDDIDGDGIKNFEDLDSDSSGDSVAATPETTQARVPRSFFGVVSEDIFWASRPDLPERPLRSYQIWNEPNIKSYWPTGADPEAYVAMLRTVGGAIRAADPSAEIVGAGLPESPGNMPVKEFVSRMYRAGAKGAFDTIALHPYASSADRSFDIVDNLRKLMDANGDPTSRIWVTEIGWADQGPVAQFTVGARGQYEMIRRVFATLVGQSARLRLRGIIYFNWRDAVPYGDRADFWGLHTGLYEIGGKPKPALDGYTSTVRTLVAG